MLFRSRNKLPASLLLRGMISSKSVFLIGGGPSINALPLELLAKKGVWSLAINNVAAHPRIRPQAFIAADPPEKFSHSIWADPGIMKFIPIQKLGGQRGNLRRKIDGQFEPFGQAHQAPNVWAFERRCYLWPDDRFFSDDGAMWGNLDEGVDRTGEPKTVNTFFLAIRLLHFLGAKKIFLIGLDFKMALDYGYAFNQARDAQAVASNNDQFEIAGDWLFRMQEHGVFARAGIQIFNCNFESGLRAFPFKPFEEAVKEAQGVCETTPSLDGWYEK